jgi:hypothetical protein
MTLLKTDVTFRGGYVHSLAMTLHRNQETANDRLTICKEFYMSIPVVIYTVKDFFLLNEFNEVMSRMKAAGLIERWQNIDKRFMKNEESNKPKILSLQKCLGCFYLLFIGWCCGAIAFLVEFVNQTCKKH